MFLLFLRSEHFGFFRVPAVHLLSCNLHYELTINVNRQYTVSNHLAGRLLKYALRPIFTFLNGKHFFFRSRKVVCNIYARVRRSSRGRACSCLFNVNYYTMAELKKKNTPLAFW